jgi:hypothetical protein
VVACIEVVNICCLASIYARWPVLITPDYISTTKGRTAGTDFEEHLLVSLKQKKSKYPWRNQLPWKQIAEFFPDHSQNGLSQKYGRILEDESDATLVSGRWGTGFPKEREYSPGISPRPSSSLSAVSQQGLINSSEVHFDLGGSDHSTLSRDLNGDYRYEP